MKKVLWINVRIFFGVVIKTVLFIPIVLVCGLAWTLCKLDKFICYLYSSADEMVQMAYSEKIFGGSDGIL